LILTSGFWVAFVVRGQKLSVLGRFLAPMKENFGAGKEGGLVQQVFFTVISPYMIRCQTSHYAVNRGDDFTAHTGK